MKQNFHFFKCYIFLSLPFIAGTASAAEPEWQYPRIQEYGKVLPMPNAEVHPNPNRESRIVVNVTKPMSSPNEVNPGLDRIARLVNLFALSRVPPEKLKIVAVIHGGATVASLDNSHYREKYQIDNPNTKLIESLKEAGVTVFICGQALAHNDFDPSWVNQDITIALSAMMVLAHYQSDGYALVE